jgi:dienelactone hydrolase
MSESFSHTTAQKWNQARRTAFVQDILAALTDRPADLLPFEEVRRRLQLRQAHYLGLRDVPLDQIVGSIGRYRDFSRAFFPRREQLKERWQRIEQLATLGGGFPPVELYKVGQVYFVRDGNHRVSVARQLRAPAIQAYVWEYETRVPLDPDTDASDLLNKAARTAFFERTNLDHICPDTEIQLSEPDGYEELLYEIQVFQQNLSRIDGRRIPFSEAVELWCEMQYTAIVEIIRRRDILHDFPDRTEADLYLWLRRNQEELEARYGSQVPMEEAADDLAERFAHKPSRLSQFKKVAERLAESMGEWSGRLAENIALTERPVKDQAQAAALLAAVRRQVTAVPPFRFQGTTMTEWHNWRDRFRRQLWDLLGVGEHPRQPFAPEQLEAEITERVDLDGLQREMVWLNAEGDLRLPAYLFLPQSQGPSPAIVVFPGHGTIAQTAGLKKSYQRANALRLARAGFVTLTMELRGFGKLGALGHLQIDAAARLVGRTWYGLLVQDAMRAIDYLLTRPEVDAKRIGATGIGAGGALTLYTTALDDRIQAALVNSYLGKYITTCLDQDHCPCNDIPGMLRTAEMGDVAALLAPRPAMFVNGRRDPASSHVARESLAIARGVYSFLGLSRRVKLIEPEELGHQFDNQLAANWFRRWLAQRRIGERVNPPRQTDSVH